MKFLPGHLEPQELALCALLPCPGIQPLSVPVYSQASAESPGPVCSSCFLPG